MNAKLQLVSRARETVDLARLARMKPDQLRQLHRKIFDRDVPSGNSEQARRRIAWHVQAQREGGLPESARQHALAIAREADIRIRARGNAKRGDALRHVSVTAIVSDHDPRLPMPGSVLVKEYRGQTISVHVLDNGFEWNARRFTSLSAIAKEITGTKWNGLLFFGLAKGRARGR
jgi:Protein of unknown function (DUF2924)